MSLESYAKGHEKHKKGKGHMAFGDLIAMKCPNCGNEVATPLKEWDLSPKVHVKLYECCGKKFREYISKK
ncbi:MAG: hypothetical protein NWF14_02905 [Candidatus Bathyarchaeota archaeon]|nr:hypothetical protein [Candidatus Bathyarchaeota archaeon]